MHGGLHKEHSSRRLLQGSTQCCSWNSRPGHWWWNKWHFVYLWSHSWYFLIGQYVTLHAGATNLMNCWKLCWTVKGLWFVESDEALLVVADIRLMATLPVFAYKKKGLKIKPLLLGPLDSLDLGQNHRACLRRIPRLPATGQARQQDRPNGPCRENQGRWWRVVALPTAFSRPHPPLSWPWYGLVGRWPPQTTLPKLLSCQDV